MKALKPNRRKNEGFGRFGRYFGDLNSDVNFSTAFKHPRARSCSGSRCASSRRASLPLAAHTLRADHKHGARGMKHKVVRATPKVFLSQPGQVILGAITARPVLGGLHHQYCRT
jgi:hypothetical protein